jgi:hypothetical protein
MKKIAISVRQPWADLIIWGIKTIEVRQWSSNYRGILYIHSSKTLDEIAMNKFHITDPPTGAIIGKVDLIKVEPFTEKSWSTLADEHLNDGPFSPGLYAWYLASPTSLKNPIPYKGNLGLFTINFDE